MSTDQVLFGVGLIIVLAVGSQLLASRLHSNNQLGTTVGTAPPVRLSTGSTSPAP